MARTRSQVASLFGATPQQIMAEERKRMAALAQGQQSNEQKFGSGLVMALGSLFGGKSKALQAAEQREGIAQGAVNEQTAALAEQASIQDRLAYGDTMDEGAGAMPIESIKGEPTTADEFTNLQTTYQRNAQLYETIAERLAGAGFVNEAESARNEALKNSLGALQARRAQADLAYVEAQTTAKLAPVAPKITDRTTFTLPDGSKVMGANVNGVLSIYSQGQWLPAPDGVIESEPDLRPKTTGAPTMTDAKNAMPWIRQDPLAKELSTEKQGALAGWMAGEASRMLDQGETTDPNEAYAKALQNAKDQGLLSKDPATTVLGIDVPFTGGSEFNLPGQTGQTGQDGVAEGRQQGADAFAAGQQQATTGTGQEASRRVMPDGRVAVFDANKKFIRWVTE